MQMNRTKQELVVHLRVDSVKALVVLKVSMISSDKVKEVKAVNHLEMFLKNLRSFSLEDKEEERKAHKQLREKT
jgi:hypothetical protein